MPQPPTSPAIRWVGDALELLDQRLLPVTSEWVHCRTAAETAAAITDMVVRGAPAIGISAAYGVVLASRVLGIDANRQSLQPALDVLAASRPTAVNLFWALEQMQAVIGELHGDALTRRLEQEAIHIHQDDIARNLTMARHGAVLVPPGKAVYTHCNTGALATGGHGTALGIIRTAWADGRIPGVFAGETRPWLQGARLTAWELQQDQIPVTLVVDSAAGSLMASGQIGAVLVGADRITANGDTANKIGTYNLAVLARHHGIPFFVAAPLSTIDMSLANGDTIEIETRPGSEITQVKGQQLAPADIDAFNPAFDVTPAELITAIVTERGVVQSPDLQAMQRHMEQPS